MWRHPRSLQQLHVAVSGVKPADLRLLAGNTGSGVYKNWPVEPVVVDIRGIAELDYLHRTSEVPTLLPPYTPCTHCGCGEARDTLTSGTCRVQIPALSYPASSIGAAAGLVTGVHEFLHRPRSVRPSDVFSLI